MNNKTCTRTGDVQMLPLTLTASPVTPLIPLWCCASLCALQAWLCLIALGVSFLATRRQNDTTILIQQQPEFDT